MTKNEEETLAALGMFRASCVVLAMKYEAAGNLTDVVKDLRDLLAETTPEPLPSTDEVAILNLRVVAKEVAALRVMVGRLSEEVVDLSKRITLAPQEER